MFRDVPECSGMFHVPGFIDGLGLSYWLLIASKIKGKKQQPNREGNLAFAGKTALERLLTRTKRDKRTASKLHVR